VAERRPPGPPDLLRRGTADHYEDPELYDFEYRDHRHDIRWYRDLARALGAGLEILELGAGTGRISLPLAADGHRVEPVLGDITAIPLPDASFDLVIAPFNVLMHLYRWQDLLACFREARRVLVPGGTFALDVLLPDLEWLGWDQEERHSVTYFTHPRTGASMVYSTNHTYDPDTQVCHVRIYYDDAPKRPRAFKPPPVPVQVVHLAHRQIFPEELRLLIASAGFDLVSHTADFRAGALKKESEAQVVVARKPGDPTPITE
jgi:SAM-dependent methyltransferase